jgi:hypothetical protein
MESCANKNTRSTPDIFSNYDETITHYRNYYNKKDKLITVEIEEEHTFLDEKKYTNTIQEYIYDSNSQLTTIKTYLNDNIDKSLIKIQNFGNFYTETIEFSNNDTISYEKIVTDHKGRDVECSTKRFSGSGSNVLEEYSVSYSQYDENSGREISSMDIDLKEDKTTYYEYKYVQSADTLIKIVYENKNISIIEKIFFDKQKNIKYEWNFNESDLLLYGYEYWMKDNEIYLRIGFHNEENNIIVDSTFYENGKDVKLIMTDPSFITIQTDKKYDKYGNIVEVKEIMRPSNGKKIQMKK